jgi:hypothetical protein
MKVARIEWGQMRSGSAMPAVLARRRMRRQAAIRSRAVPFLVDQDWSRGALTDAGLEGDEDVGGQGRGGALVALAAVAEHAVAVGDGQVFDAGVERLADP